MTDLSTCFFQAKANNSEAVTIISNYFMQNISQQLKNYGILGNDYNEKYHQCFNVVLRNLHKYYDYDKFLTATIKETKEIIYLNKKFAELNSRDIISESDEYIRSRVMDESFNTLNVPLVYRECARKYYINNVSIEELSQIYRCTPTLICKRLRMVANVLFMNKIADAKEDEKKHIA